jgi:hypothetical protein
MIIYITIKYICTALIGEWVENYIIARLPDLLPIFINTKQETAAKLGKRPTTGCKHLG